MVRRHLWSIACERGYTQVRDDPIRVVHERGSVAEPAIFRMDHPLAASIKSAPATTTMGAGLRVHGLPETERD